MGLIKIIDLRNPIILDGMLAICRNDENKLCQTS